MFLFAIGVFVCVYLLRSPEWLIMQLSLHAARLQPTSSIISIKDSSQHTASHIHTTLFFSAKKKHLCVSRPTPLSSVKYSLCGSAAGATQGHVVFYELSQENCSEPTCPLSHPWPNHMLMCFSRCLPPFEPMVDCEGFQRAAMRGRRRGRWEGHGSVSALSG